MRYRHVHTPTSDSARTRRAMLVIVSAVLWVMVLASPALAAKYEPAEDCGCHAALLQQWSATMHSQAITDPIYLAKLREANMATKGAIGPFCDGCHAPAARITGTLKKGPTGLSGADVQGVGCDYCHRITGIHPGKPVNGSNISEPGGAKRAQLKGSVSPAHETQYSAVHESAELCGTCHNVDHPANGLALEATYSEWKAGPYAKRGIVCQDCHMTPGAGVTKPNPGKAAAMGPERPHIYTMTFVGGNTALGDKTLAEERLKAAAEVEIDAPEGEASGTVPVKVKVTNVGAGHYIPTGLTDFRQMWLTVTAETSDGEVLLEARRDFGTVFKDKKGRHPAQIWDAVAVYKDDRIPPKKSVTAEYELDVPADTEVEVRATLQYRSATEEYAKKAKVAMEPTLMASAKTAINAGSVAESAASGSDGKAASGGGLGLVLSGGAIVFVGLVIGLTMRKRGNAGS